MPLFYYKCSNCECSEKRFIRKVADAPPSFDCKCGEKLTKQLSGPSSASKISVDNGVQARAVEILEDITIINEERSRKDDRQY